MLRKLQYLALVINLLSLSNNLKGQQSIRIWIKRSNNIDSINFLGTYSLNQFGKDSLNIYSQIRQPGIYFIYQGLIGQDSINNFKLPVNHHQVNSWTQDSTYLFDLNLLSKDTCFRLYDSLLMDGNWKVILFDRAFKVHLLREKNILKGFADGAYYSNNHYNQLVYSNKTIYQKGFIIYRKLWTIDSAKTIETIYKDTCQSIEMEQCYENGILQYKIVNGYIFHYNKKGTIIRKKRYNND